MGKRVLAIIQARLTSTRLPNKVLKNISGKPVLWHLYERLKAARKIDGIVLAIPDSPQNDKLAEFAREMGLSCFRGSEQDVLSRYYHSAVESGAQVIVRITSDCPLIDPHVTDSVVEAHLNSGADYTCSGVESGFPRGLDTEVINFETLEMTFKEAIQDYEHEHVTPYIYQHPELFKTQFIEATGKLRRPDLRLTVDTEDDLKLIRAIYKLLYRDGEIFYIEDVIDLLDKYPALASINANTKQKELKG